MTDYPMVQTLTSNARQHCAAIAITENHRTDERGGLVFSEPHAGLRNGTLTFVSLDGRTFAITCQHVVKAYRDLASVEDGYSMRTMLSGFHVVLDLSLIPI